jgi:metal-sulfur cluster biosynthetic enzyme
MIALIVLNVIATATSIACIATSVIQNDLTEALAWLIITFYNAQNLVHNLLNDK